MTESDNDDQAALAAVRGGDRLAFVALVERYHRAIYNAAYQILRRSDDAADVTQSVFLKAMEKLEDYDPRYRFFSWIYRIAVNESIDVHRRNRREEPLDESGEWPDPDGRSPEFDLSRAQEARRLHACMLRLSVTDRTVLTLRHFSELSYEEISQILELDERTVKSRLFEARKRLRGLLTPAKVQ